MNDVFPLRSDSHRLEELSERFFTHHLPAGWTAEKPKNDYGIDMHVEIFEGQRATGLELLVQLKASAQPTGGAYEVLTLKTSTYNYLLNRLQVVMLVKFVESENEAYWLMLRDAPAPTPDQASFSIRVPRSNRLSLIQWPEIQADVRRVTDLKHAAMRRDALNIGNNLD